MIKVVLSFSMVLFLLSGCKQDEVQAIKKEEKKKDIFLEMDEEQPQQNNEGNELYFAKTHNKQYYKKIAPRYVKGWVKVIVRTKDGIKRSYYVMSSPVTKKMYQGLGGKEPITNISYSTMNDFCIKELNAMLINAYVFDAARRYRRIQKPTGGITKEIIAPIDEEDDEEFYTSKDNIIAEDGTMIEFDWKKERYIAVPNIYQSKEATFRCMRIR